ncbi:unnamed protein product, partial [Clonostachys rosea]
MESACVLCGVAISFRFSKQWLREFRAIYVEDGDLDNIRLSGIGSSDEDNYSRSCPMDPNHRYDDVDLHPDPTFKLGVSRASLDPQRINDPITRHGYAFHSQCWTLLNRVFNPDLRLLFHVCLAMPRTADTIPGILDWGHEYDGATFYSKYDLTPTIACQYPDDLVDLDTDGVFRADPIDIPGFQQQRDKAAFLENPFYVRQEIQQTGEDPFDLLPVEILQFITTYLPSRDLANLRLSSPVFAVLDISESFWASRFSIGHEFHYIFEASSYLSKSWKALYLSLQSWVQLSPGLKNRRRIWGLARKLEALQNQMVEAPCCHGNALSSITEPTAEEDNGHWQTASRSLFDPAGDDFSHGSRVLRIRLFNFSEPLELSQLHVSFVLINDAKYVSRLSITHTNGHFQCLGYIHPNNQQSILFPKPQLVHGWRLAFSLSVIVSIAVVFEDEQVSPFTYDLHTLTSIKLKYTDSSKDLLFGHNGPYDSMPAKRMYDPPQDTRYVATIDGPGGERLTAIHVQLTGITIRGLKIQTNRELKELFSLSSKSRFSDLEWKTLETSKGAITGIYAYC